MHRELTLCKAPIDEANLYRDRKLSAHMGAVVSFIGVVRGTEGNQAITAIDYEAFHDMAIHQFEILFDEIRSRWPVESIRLVHRIGLVLVNETSLWVEVIAPHRAEAFLATQFLVEEMKKRVPIWKKPILSIP